jgi:threonylcarbamoyladenosine tRNA methylthiotransferase MtaB
MAADLRLPGCAPQTISEALVSRLSEEGQARRVGRRFQLERSRGLSRVNVKIQQGCNGKCSYCIVPAARGAPVSRSIEEVQEDVRAAVEAGFREVVLAGTNIALFGCDRSSAESLAALMERLSMADPGCRLRLSSLEPDVGLSSVVSQLSSSPVWCRHLHVALQHGSDEVLALMGRDRFSFAHLASLLHDAAGAIPGLAIGLDIIVGFPGETDRLFEHCFDNLRGLPFCYLHVFSFSPRPGTLAAAMPGRPPLEVTKERSLRLRTLSDERRRDFARRQAGRRAEVLVEHRKDPSGKRLAGLTDNYLRVTMPGPDELMGSLVRSELEWAPDGYLVAVGR